MCSSLERPFDATARICARQNGFVSIQQLRAIGVSKTLRDSWLRFGRLHEVQPRTYSQVSPLALDVDARMRAVSMSAGPFVSVGLESAGVRLRIWRGSMPRVIQAVTARRHRPLRGVELRVASTFDPVIDVTEVGGVWITHAPRTTFDLGATLTKFQLANVLHRSGRNGLLDLDLIRAITARGGDRRTLAVVRRAITLHLAGCAGTRSFLEDAWVAMLQRLGKVEPLVNQRIVFDDGDWLEVDTHWPAVRLVVEVDTPATHGLPGDAERDRARDERLRATGWTVIRIGPSQVRHPPRALLDVIPDRRRVR